MSWSPDDRGLGILMVGPEDWLGRFRDIVDSQHVARILGFPIKDYHSSKSVDAITQLNRCVDACGRCYGILLHHNFSVKGKEDYVELLKKVIKDKFPAVPIICWGDPTRGGRLNIDYHYPLKYQLTDDDATEIVKVLNMLNNGEILADYSGKPTVSLATPEQLKAAAHASVRSVDAHAAPGSNNRRKSVDMQHADSPLSRRSVDMRASGMPVMPQMAGMGVMPSGGSFGGMQPGFGAPMMGVGMAPMAGYVQSPLSAPAPAPPSNEGVIKSLAEEVARLQQMVQEKRAREAAPH